MHLGGRGNLLIVVDPHTGVPVYRQIMEQIRFHIATGLLRAGDELPATRTVSQELGINPMTVSKAYGLLEEEGVVTRRPGLPLVVSRRTEAVSEVAKLEHLRGLLEPAALAAKQLGITDRQAVAVFRDTLADTDVEEQS